jgi:hypothetical protein
MKRARPGKSKLQTSKAAARSMPSGVAKRASIFRNGANQAVRIRETREMLNVSVITAAELRFGAEKAFR